MEEVICTYPCKIGSENCQCLEELAMESRELTREEAEWVSEIVYIYRDDRDWTQTEWAQLQSIMDKLDAMAEEAE